MDFIDKLIDREDLKAVAKELNRILQEKGLTAYEKHYVLRSLDSALEYNALFGGKGGRGMNEQGCAFVCAMFCVFGAVLAGYWLKTSEVSCSWIVSGIGLIVFLISGLVIACRYT